MKTIRKTIYITEDVFLGAEHGNLIVKKGKEKLGEIPLLNIQNVCVFGYTSLSAALLGKCYAQGITVSLFTPGGKLQTVIAGKPSSSVLTRVEQVRLLEKKDIQLDLARNLIFAKIYNSRWIIERYCRDYAMRIGCDSLKEISSGLNDLMIKTLQAKDQDELRGIEGAAAQKYFGGFDQLILNQKDDFCFERRSRRPPLNYMNALLSMTYSILTNEVKSALVGAGLDAELGFNHTLRPGRPSLALDLIEELRPVMADRFALSLVNRKVIQSKHFVTAETGACMLTDEGRKIFFQQWEKQKNSELTHPFLKEKITWGLVPHVQARLFSDYIRGELDAYPNFLWK